MAGLCGGWLQLAKLYGGFFVVDVRLLLWLVLLCLLVSVGGVLLWPRLKGLRQMAPAGAALFVFFFVLGLALLHWVGGYPVFVIRSFFQLP